MSWRRSGGVAGLALACLLGGAVSGAEAPLPRPRPVAAVVAPATPPAEPAPAELAPTAMLPAFRLEARLPQPRPREVQPQPGLGAGAGQNGTSAVSAAPHPTAPAPALPTASGQTEPEDAIAAVEFAARLPKARPAQVPTIALWETGPDEPSRSGLLEAPAPVEIGSDTSACLKRLRDLGVSFTPLPPISPGGACHVPVPLEVASLGSGVAITPAAVMNCRTAEGLALWIRDSVVPASRRYLEAVPNGIVHDSAYVCRARNNAPGAKLSEHATANAVDIASIRFAARPPLAIGRVRGVAEARFEAAIRRDSCAYFTTVLGPGSNAAHATHFHFDAAQRRGGYRLCDLGANVTGRVPGKT